jgi:hypothetical protein
MLIVTETEIITFDDKGGAVICLKDPVECPRCRRMAAFIVNRNGKTLCSTCDKEASAP